MKPLASSDLNVIRAGRIYSTAALPEKRWALATNTDGLYIIDQNGNRVQHFGSVVQNPLNPRIIVETF